MNKLAKQLVKLGEVDPKLRPHLIPILDKLAYHGFYDSESFVDDMEEVWPSLERLISETFYPELNRDARLNHEVDYREVRGIAYQDHSLDILLRAPGGLSSDEILGEVEILVKTLQWEFSSKCDLDFTHRDFLTSLPKRVSIQQGGSYSTIKLSLAEFSESWEVPDIT